MKNFIKDRFINLALNILDLNSNEPMSAQEIWDFANKKKLITELGSNGLTPWKTLGARLYVDNKNLFERIGEAPVKFIIRDYSKLKQNTYITEKIICSPKKERTYNKKEFALHSVLAKYVYEEFLVYTKTINHLHSENIKKNLRKWVHPDLVGVKYPFINWRNKKQTSELAKETNSYNIKLYSFELKQELCPDTNKFKESFMQAVSNSSWANEAYIAAEKISDDIISLQEIKRLSSLHGIGVIKLNSKDYKESTILFPAKTKNYIHIETVDYLSSFNTDFHDFIEEILDYKDRRNFTINADFYEPTE